MVSSRKKRRSKRRLLSQSGDFDQDAVIGDAANNWQQNIVVNDGFVDREFTANNNGWNLMANENTVNVQTLERCFNERIHREMANFVDTLEDRIQNATLTANDNITTPRIELAVRLISAPSRRDATNVTVNSERGEHIGITASCEDISERNNTFHALRANYETRKTSPTR